MIVGLGTDLVAVPRFAEVLDRTPAMAARVFTADEWCTPTGARRTVRSLAARYAAKEAARKALGAPQGTRLSDCEVVSGPDGRPTLRVTGVLATVAAELGVTAWHVSLSHDADLASATVIAEAGG